jgi:hypothetical protein
LALFGVHKIKARHIKQIDWILVCFISGTDATHTASAPALGACGNVWIRDDEMTSTTQRRTDRIDQARLSSTLELQQQTNIRDAGTRRQPSYGVANDQNIDVRRSFAAIREQSTNLDAHRLYAGVCAAHQTLHCECLKFNSEFKKQEFRLDD